MKKLIITIIVLLIAGGAFYLFRERTKVPTWVTCTTEAKICPDGSSVGRIPPRCEFAACPTVATSTAVDTSDWKTCRNEKYGYEVRYPSTWKVWQPASGGYLPASCDDNLFQFVFSIGGYAKDSYLEIDVENPETLKGTFAEGIKSLDDYFAISPMWKKIYERGKILVLDGEKAVLLDDRQLEVFHDGSLFTFWLGARSEDRALVDMILSTFKFTK